MSSTARLILDTLDKMSTPIQVATKKNHKYVLKNADVLEQKLIGVDQDAKKMPALVQPRAEKRKLIEEELNCSLKVFYFHHIIRHRLMLSEENEKCPFCSRPRGAVSGLGQELSPLRAHLSG